MTQTNSYNRRLMTQRFTHRGVTTDQSSLQFSDVTKLNPFPRLELKSRERSSVGNNLYDTAGIIIQEQSSGLGSPKVFMRNMKSRRQTGVLKPNNTQQKLSLLNYDKHDAAQTEAQRHGSRGKSGGHLFDFENYEALSDEQCIVRNSYNIVRTSGGGESLRSSMSGKVMFKVISPKKKGFAEDNSSD